MLWRLLSVLLIIFLFVLATSSGRTPRPTTTTVATSSAQTAAPISAVTAATWEFSATGTLVFYPNNVGPVPYIFYTNQNGNTVAKALIFDNLPPTDFSSWTGARISVSGVLDREHVIVREIAYLAPP